MIALLASPLFALACASSPAVPAVQAAQEPVVRQALALHDDGNALAAIEVLMQGIESRAAAGDYAGAEVFAEMEALLLLQWSREYQRGPELLAGLEELIPKLASAPPRVAFLLGYLRGEVLRNVGALGQARRAFDGLGYANEYQLIGPFDNERGAGFGKRYAPEMLIDPDVPVEGKEREVSWRPIPGNAHALYRMLIGETLRPKEQVLGYLATAIYGDSAQDVVLRIGSSCAFEVFLNGESLAQQKVERPFFPDQNRVVLPLVAGWNTLLLKVGVEDYAWALDTRFTDLAGRPLPGLTFDASMLGRVEIQKRTSAASPAAEAVDLLMRATTDAESQRLLALYHLIVHPGDRTDMSARDAAQRSLELEPEDLIGRYLLSQALYPRVRSRSEMALQPYLRALAEVIDLHPTHHSALLDQANIYAELIPRPFRVDELTALALEQVPDSYRALRSRAGYLDSRRRSDQATSLRRQADVCPEGATRSSSLLRRARRQLALGKRAEAERLLRMVLARQVTNPATVRSLIEVLLDEDRGEEAAMVMGECMNAAPFSVAPMIICAQLFEYAGMEDMAQRVVQTALEICPDHRTALMRSARLAWREGRMEQADEMLAKVLRIDPGADQVRRMRALLTTGAEEELRFETPWRRDASALVGTPLPDAAANETLEALDRTTVYRVYPDGAESQYEHVVLRPLNLAGVQALDGYPIVYPAGGSLHVYGVRILHADGTVERVPAPRGRDRVRGGQALRYYDLPPVKVGDIIDIEYRIDETEPDVFGEYFGTRHAFYPERLDSMAPTRRSELAVIAPPGLELFSAEQNAGSLVKTRTTDEAGNTVLTWVASNLQRPLTESSMPARQDIVPLVDVSTYRDWQEFGDWWWSFIEKEFDTSPAMEAKVLELVAGLETEADRVQAIAQFVGQEIRYNAWAFGTHGYEPFSASTIFERRFGDCKDKSILLRQMLAQIGVEAVPVLIKAGYSRAKEPLGAAMVGAFNHCIAYVTPTPERKGYYLDATADRNPLDYLRADDQGARVLHVTPDGSELHDIPYAQASENSMHREYDVQLAADGSAQVRMLDSSSGNFGVRLRYFFGGEQGDLEKKLGEQLATHFGQVEFADIHVSELDDIGVPAQVEASFKTETLGSAQGAGRQLPLSFDPLGFDGIALEEPAERKYEVTLDRPLGVHTVVRWHLPSGATVRQSPAAVSLAEKGIGIYRLDTKEEGGVLTVERRFELQTRRVSLADYARFREFVQAVRLAEQSILSIEIR